ncbi:MAG TPA: ribosomal protein S18-alanine N-acetyltransferase [Spirochaetota bacterium]|nr:ribosomal protein S18-alanine N-acetyltransferase [Spirochaetota bacterium]
MKIRNALDSDLDTVYSLENEWMQSPWTRMGFENELSNTFSHFVVVENEDGIAGYAVAWEVSGEIQLNRIVVRGDLRRRGFGRALLGHLLREMRPPDAGRVLLEVRARNDAARCFYRAAGFIETGLRKRYYGDDDAVLMERTI